MQVIPQIENQAASPFAVLDIVPVEIVPIEHPATAGYCSPDNRCVRIRYIYRFVPSRSAGRDDTERRCKPGSAGSAMLDGASG